ncbi:type II toxin-antitoxin system RelE/ParE family toxin [Photobacterium leiognathi]|uniref:type II toxin-antitoxin system RelE/ParE family toxin n=1 Tax=Photobacterium leiognathi TaxID=553611 RepID=UPI00273990AE|nr:type II toxin-antitoxin system RelE/ParE family toxin [Photobacterium leiognathi]
MAACFSKKRVAKVNQGKSGGYRTMVGARLGNRFVFVYMFEKNSRDNITEQEVKALKKLVRLYLDADYDWLEQQILNGLLFKVNHEE